MKRFYILVEGRVQGVGFRYTMQMYAMKLDLTGWVRNLDNGNVEIEVQGEEENLNKFLQLMLQGNRFIRVDDYAVKEINVEIESSFIVK